MDKILNMVTNYSSEGIDKGGHLIPIFKISENVTLRGTVKYCYKHIWYIVVTMIFVAYFQRIRCLNHSISVYSRRI